MATTTRSNAKNAERSEFELCLAAKAGDASANIQLWKKYMPVTISMLKHVPGMTVEEKLSEAYVLFLHKLDYFDPQKVLEARSPDTFTFSYMMTGGLKNLRDKFFRAGRRELRNVSWTPFDDDQDTDCPYKFTEFNPYHQGKEYINNERFDTYSPENNIFCDSDKGLNEKAKKFYGELSEFQCSVLNLRKEGMTIKEIGIKLNCSTTTVKTNILEAKRKAAKIFGRYPSLKIA
jgi:DNA-directed RNA polymerase specialized sigma24 family protein